MDRGGLRTLEKGGGIVLRAWLIAMLIALVPCNSWALSQSNGYYQIGTAQDLVDFASLVNSGTTSANAILTADIDISGYSDMIGTSGYPYAGTFNGAGHTVTINYNTSTQRTALFSYVSGATIKNLTTAGSITTSEYSAAGIVGRVVGTSVSLESCISSVDIISTMDGDGTHGGLVGVSVYPTYINNCAFIGSITGASTYSCGGLVGYIRDTAAGSYIKNSYVAATFSLSSSDTASETFARYASSAKPTLTNSYYLNAIRSGSSQGTYKTEEEFTSGEVCYLLNGESSKEVAWYQELGTDSYPVLTGGKIVYPVYDTCVNLPNYSNTEESNIKPESCTYTNGICATCGECQAATLNDNGVYEIGNAGQLIWFSALVNGDTTFNGITSAKPSANAILTADIDMTDVSYTPIGSSSKPYTGIFNGNNKTITGLTISGSQYLGLIGYTGDGAKVKDLGLKDVSISATVQTDSYSAALVGYASSGITLTNCYVEGGTITGKQYLGGLIGWTNSTATLTGCYNTSTVTSTSTYFGYVGGLIGKADSTTELTNCYNTGSISATGDYIGGLIGLASSTLTITNCYNTGSVTATGYKGGGLIGYAKSTVTIENCYNTGTISGSTVEALAIISRSSSFTITNCYYVSTVSSSYGTSMDASAFVSGEVCYLLNGESSEEVAWYQDLENDSYPVLTGGKIVYPVYDTCINIPNYSNTYTDKATTCTYTNGICATCGEYQPATLNSEGIYEIGNAGQLIWFSALVNGDTTFNGITSAKPSANAILTADIDMTDVSYTPIGSSSKPYTGIFNGNNKTITGLTISGSQYLGLIGYTGDGAKVKDLGLKDVSISATVQTNSYSAALVGYASSDITLTNCYVDGGEISGKQYLGGLIGWTNSTATLTGCYNTATVSGSSFNAGGLIGCAGSTAELTNCYNTGGVTATGNCAGGLMGQASSTTTITNCYNTGSVTATSYNGGGLIGYATSTLTIENCYNTGTIWSWGYAAGLIGRATNTSTTELTNCYNIGSTRLNEFAFLEGSYTVTNCYYLSTGGGSYGTSKEASAFASGEVTYLLNSESSEEAIWYQELGTDNYPVLTGTKIVYPVEYCITVNYTNDEGQAKSVINHDYDNYTDDMTKCPNCDAEFSIKFYTDSDEDVTIEEDTTVDLARYTRNFLTGYSTLALPFDCSIPEDSGITIYAVTSADPITTSGATQWITFDEFEGTTLSANTGYLVKVESANESEEETVTVVFQEYSATLKANNNIEKVDNDLVPVFKTETLSADDTIFKLAYSNGEYFFNHSNGTAQINPFRAYLYVPTTTASGAPVRLSISFGNEDGETTTINASTSASMHVCESAIYNLAGQKVNPDNKGIVIKNGCKVLVK